MSGNHRKITLAPDNEPRVIPEGIRECICWIRKLTVSGLAAVSLILIGHMTEEGVMWATSVTIFPGHNEPVTVTPVSHETP